VDNARYSNRRIPARPGGISIIADRNEAMPILWRPAGAIVQANALSGLPVAAPVRSAAWFMAKTRVETLKNAVIKHAMQQNNK
jgi:hypothetical protein